ncbi:8-amino-7-oxononanoate synthase [Priestia filamentosa]|uniref:8-amino-7-ketopelargonate synthase n=1 Tax=Priestia filamentosa TaxID=1402861 RepID=A0A1X7EAE0_9BACI|nr:8-amino-7-oxononanoate synthase [Priestia filamentosa]AKO92614.1 8-amino-7-oxononanoate synthase [Priestia filamentosa]MDT3762693.1 8-amino-7-oxononanoate synthase [Priestia filamentosa]OXS69228.1 8-amino-7-oxononanoate synthase [Priestia filamentosa]RJS64060.1 8-amino-7-oxononanoate synthase [Priestia filamentosa]WCM17758.1 8-amino-7-oxononanoate synthase [Priestia filamentosa]
MVSFNDELENRLLKMKEKGLYRTLKTMQSAPETEVDIDGRKQLVCSSNNYLGLSNDRRLIRAAQNAVETFGVGSSGARLTTGNTLLHERLEKKLASFKKTESALLFSSGYLANIGVLSSIPGKSDVILSDQLNHASIIDGCRLSRAHTVIYEHINMADLEKKLEDTGQYERRFIVTDGVFSMDGTLAPLPEIMKLAEKYKAYVIVDDAHATGVLGKTGGGTSEHFHVHPDIIIGTLSKAVGTEGGFVAGSHTLIDFLRNHARTFIFQTAMSPAICTASYTALEIIGKSTEKRSRLFGAIEEITKRLKDMGFNVKGGMTPIVAVLIGDSTKAVSFSQRLQSKGIYTSAIRPPTVAEGQSRIRITITSEYKDNEIERILESFYVTGKEMKVI